MLGFLDPVESISKDVGSKLPLDLCSQKGLAYCPAVLSILFDILSPKDPNKSRAGGLDELRENEVPSLLYAKEKNIERI
ncbi:unnamed protein product [Trichobilharzia regenti]|nr:unnamed protein product [Trichobilharzia regenti]